MYYKNNLLNSLGIVWINTKQPQIQVLTSQRTGLLLPVTSTCWQIKSRENEGGGSNDGRLLVRMPVVNLSVVSPCRTHIAWTVVQIEDGLTFVTLFQKILAGAHPRLQVDEQLSHWTLDKVFVGHSKDSMSVVDDTLVVNDVCSMFGSHIKYLVQLQLTVQDAPQSWQTPRNAFTILMSSSRARESEKKLPPQVQVRTKKDQLYNDVVAFEKNGWEWTTHGDTHGKKFVQQLQETLWYIDGHHQSFADRSHPIPSIFKSFVGYNTPELSKHRKSSHTNMSSDTLKRRAGCLKTFLLSPWMKRPVWDTIWKAIEELSPLKATVLTDLDAKNKAVKVHHDTPVVASDDLAFSVLKETNDFPVILNPICEALKEKDCYDPISVRDFAPVDRQDWYAYIRQLARAFCKMSWSREVLDQTLATIDLFGKFQSTSSWKMPWPRTSEL